MNWIKIEKYYNTIKYLKSSQLYWQFYNKICRKKKFLTKQDTSDITIDENLLFKFTDGLDFSYLGNNNFEFLNLKKQFKNSINWNFLDYGKLWNYNLEYFNYLKNPNIDQETKLLLINDFYNYSIENKRVLEPYPISLRSINIIQFILKNGMNCDNDCIKNVYLELRFLNFNYEYHILGNHLLENAFALFLGGAFFKNQNWHKKAKNILFQELKEQILNDGAHIELSPMYHTIIFYRVLELIDWYSNYQEKDDAFLLFCKDIASIMRSWLEQITFENGDIPLFNDAAQGITYSSNILLNYSDLLNIKSSNKPLSDSGYRTFTGDKFEIKLDLAQIGASYQPGHAHADALSFIVYVEGKPLFVEQGTSTYQIGERRNIERSTSAHNTVSVNDEDQSVVWGGFRVAQRAKTTIHKENSNTFIASHDGYKRLGVIHTRNFILNNREIQLDDVLSRNADAKFHLHLHPDYILSRYDEYTFAINEKIKISFSGAIEVLIDEYEYADSFNQYKKGQKLIVSFEEKLISKIQFEL